MISKSYEIFWEKHNWQRRSPSSTRLGCPFAMRRRSASWGEISQSMWIFDVLKEWFSSNYPSFVGQILHLFQKYFGGLWSWGYPERLPILGLNDSYNIIHVCLFCSQTLCPSQGCLLPGMWAAAQRRAHFLENGSWVSQRGWTILGRALQPLIIF